MTEIFQKITEYLENQDVENGKISVYKRQKITGEPYIEASVRHSQQSWSYQEEVQKNLEETYQETLNHVEEEYGQDFQVFQVDSYDQPREVELL